MKLRNTLVKKFRELEENSVLQSGEAFHKKMKDRHIEELTQNATSPTPLVDSELR